LKLFQEWQRGDKRRMMEEVNSTMTYYRTFVNVTIYPQYNNNKKITP
jgi:hypothetical protein